MTSKAEKARRQRITAAMRLIEHKHPTPKDDEPKPQNKVRYMVQPKEVGVVVVG